MQYKRPQLERESRTRLLQLKNRSTYITFRCTIPPFEFTLTSRNLFLYRPDAKVVTDISVSVFSERQMDNEYWS